RPSSKPASRPTQRRPSWRRSPHRRQRAVEALARANLHPTSVEQPQERWAESFKAWVWQPRWWRPRVRGLYTATLDVHDSGFTITARPFEERLSGWHQVNYEWPAVVIERLIPTGGPGL